MVDPDLNIINESLRALRDHFEAKGKRFILGYYLHDESVHKANANLISTSASTHKSPQEIKRL